MVVMSAFHRLILNRVPLALFVARIPPHLLSLALADSVFVLLPALAALGLQRVGSTLLLLGLVYLAIAVMKVFSQ